jgi:hypothetical protein
MINRIFRSTTFPAALVCSALAGAGVAGAFDTDYVPEGDVGERYAPVPDSAAIEAVAADPDGGREWAVRVYESRAGLRCVQLGRRYGERIGNEVAGRLHELRAEEGGTCGDTRESPVLVGITRLGDFPLTEEREPARTLVAGVAADGVRTVRVYGPDGPRSLKPARRGAFITVYEGEVPDARIEAVLDDGTTRQVG